MLDLMMKSRWHSVGVITALATTLFILPPVFLLACAALALITLRHGALEAGIIGAVILVLLLGIRLALGGTGTSWILGILLLWIPVVSLADLVRRYGNIRYAFIYAVVIALGYWLVLSQLTGGDSVAFWQQWLTQFGSPVLRQLGMSEAQLSEAIKGLAAHMNGAIIAGACLLVLLSVLIGRVWQARLYNPGGFGLEFRTLVLGQPLAIATVVVVATTLFAPQLPALVGDMRQFLLLLFVFQGLAVLYDISVKKSWPNVIIIVVCVLLFIIPQLGLVLSVVGIIDQWLRLRERIAA